MDSIQLTADEDVDGRFSEDVFIEVVEQIDNRSYRSRPLKVARNGFFSVHVAFSYVFVHLRRLKRQLGIVCANWISGFAVLQDLCFRPGNIFEDNAETKYCSFEEDGGYWIQVKRMASKVCSKR